MANPAGTYGSLGLITGLLPIARAESMTPCSVGKGALASFNWEKNDHRAAKPQKCPRSEVQTSDAKKHSEKYEEKAKVWDDG
jgi:hypothetical protein